MELFENDYISITGKKAAAEHIEKCYGDFGWSLKEKKDDKLYGDTVHMTFSRPHCIAGKDELQLLQVRLEIAYNKTGKYNEKKKYGALICGNFYLFAALIFICCGVCFIIFDRNLFTVIAASILFAIGAATLILGAIVAAGVYKHDKRKYELLIDAVTEEIDELCAKAKKLRGAE